MRHLAILSRSFTPYISGSDMRFDDVIDRLNRMGIDAYQGVDIDKVSGVDMVIYSSAVQVGDPELTYAREQGITCIERREYLALLENISSLSIAIAGTHGKSTCTAILSNIFGKTSLSFTSHIGAETKGNQPFRNGFDYFITEACEYRRSFLSLSPSIGVVLNIDYDHPDEYSSIDDIHDAFYEFMEKSEIVICHESVGYKGAFSYGESEDVDYRIVNVVSHQGKYDFDIVHKGKTVHITSPLYGRHNIYNVVPAYIVASLVGIDENSILEGISSFSGLKRRFEEVGYTLNGAKVITDYAHHPEEIRRSISTAHETTTGNVIVVFEPHTYSRTKSLIDDFVGCFYWADSLVLLPTFSAREREEDGYTTIDLICRLNEAGEYPLYFNSYKLAKEYLEKVDAGDTILLLGAGSIDVLASSLVVR